MAALPPKALALMWVKPGKQKPDEKRHASMCHATQPVVGIGAAFNLNA
jgi:hypothetical protein